jgi:M6 family metalloprotease-like protein
MLGGARPPASYYDLVRVRPDAFEFSRENGWIVRGRAVANARGSVRAAAASGLTAAVVGAGASNLTVAGTLRVPVFLALYANTDSTALVSFASRAAMEARLFGSATAPPYTLSTYYQEISRGRLTVTGAALEWRRVSQSDTYYENGCNGLCGGTVAGLIAELVQAHDPFVDFGLYDNDGPDAVPNSGDDDGYVDAVVVFHPEVDGACRAIYTPATNNIWAHKSSVSIATADPSSSPGLGDIRVRDYIVQGVQGGDGGCTPGQPQAIGVVAHETGHLLGLPDLYDSGATEGIGHWGLMGSGNWNRPHRPAHMEAWSRAQLGWVAELVLPRDSTISLRAVELADTAVIVPAVGTNEYFLLENRQRVGSDSLIHGPGLLIWHVDSVLIRQRRPFNTVNSVFPHGLDLVQADGADDLGTAVNRGDAGDPYPGAVSNTRFTATSTPAARLHNGAIAQFAIDSIRQITAVGPVAFRLRFGIPLLTSWSGPGVVISNPAVPGDTLLAPGTTVTLTAVANTGATFDGWSGDTTTPNATLSLTMNRPWSVQAIFAAVLAAAPINAPQAVMGAAYQLPLSATGGGANYVWSLQSGTLPKGVTVRTAGSIAGVPEETGSFPVTVRVTSGAQTADQSLTLNVGAPALATADVLGSLLGTSGSLTADEIRYLDLLGNRNGRYDVGDFRAFIDKTGGAVSAEVMAELLRKEGAR